MSKTLGGSLFIRNGVTYDYNFQESILCLLEFCDKVSVLDAGSTDYTTEILREMKRQYPELIITYLQKEDWEGQHGREKLSYFSNIAIEKLGNVDYNFSLQADEILSEKSYAAVRSAIENDHEGIICRRINLWKSPYLELNVPHNRMPCSEYIVRLAKPKYQHYDDAESIGVIANEDYAEKIRIYHMGFVRKREVMKAKIINMQQGVFAMENYDHKLDQCDIFNPDLWFSDQDLKPISEPLPLIIQDWAKERHYND